MVKIDNESDFQEAIKALRADHTETNWVLAAHVDNIPDTIRLTGSGSGGVDQLVASLNENSVMYGIVRVTQKIDLSTTVKFAYVYFIGEQVPALLRGKIATHSSDIKKLFSPFHIDFEITNPSEIDSSVIDKKISENTGKVDKVRDVSYDGSQHERGFTSSSSVNSGVKKSSFGFQGQNSAATAGNTIPADSAVAEAIADVRNDKTETNWTVAAYEGNDLKKKLAHVASGNGGIDEATANLGPDVVAYILIRVVDVIEKIRTVKFAFITYVGPDVPIMKKAKVTTNKGGVTALFNPFHVSQEITNASEVSDESLLALVQDASGSKSKVK